MYNRILNVLIVSQNPQLETLLQSAPSVERLSCEFFCRSKIRETELNGHRIVILDFNGAAPISQEIILSAKEARALVVGCFSVDDFPVLAEHHHLFDQVWIKPFVEDQIQFSFYGLLKRIQKQENELLYEKYLETLIDSLPDLIWFKDAMGAHLKVNNSFCKAVSKTKAQIEGARSLLYLGS